MIMKLSARGVICLRPNLGVNDSHYGIRHRPPVQHVSRELIVQEKVDKL